MITLHFFDFLNEIEEYDDTSIARMKLRHSYLVEPFEKDIQGARVLDIAAHDGRWSYALAAAGAAEVYGIEARSELIEKFANYPERDFKNGSPSKRMTFTVRWIIS